MPASRPRALLRVVLLKIAAPCSMLGLHFVNKLLSIVISHIMGLDCLKAPFALITGNKCTEIPHSFFERRNLAKKSSLSVFSQSAAAFSIMKCILMTVRHFAIAARVLVLGLKQGPRVP